jgi:polysaccharide chain length determinant protein (PEP-CTERM system associated)
VDETEGNLGDTIDQIRGFIIRRRWWILATACGIALATVAFVSRLPDRYSSEATLVVRQQQVSQRYVEPTNTTTTSDALKSMMQEVLSRNRLLGIIEEFGLYAKAKQHLTPEELVELMRKDIAVEPLDEIRGNLSAFKISFTLDSARTAQAVTSRLTSLFIEEHLRTRGSQATTTTNFLTEQLEAAKQKLKQQDDRRGAFKMQYLGELPERQPANFEMLTELRSQLQTTITSLSRAQQQRMSLESSLGESLARLQSEKTKLLTRYTSRHPDVIKKDQEIEKITTLLGRLTKQANGSDKPINVMVPDDPSLGLLQHQVEANDLETENLSKDEKRLRAEIVQYQNRLNLTPIREQQLAEILRDYDQYAQAVRDLQAKLVQAQQTTSVEEHQEGQQFRLVDPPTLPIVPTSPKRLKINLGGLAGGIMIGLALAFLRDSRDRSFHSEKSLSQLFSLPLVLSVPLLLTPTEERGRKWKTAFEWMAGSVMLLAVFAVEFYVYRRG